MNPPLAIAQALALLLAAAPASPPTPAAPSTPAATAPPRTAASSPEVKALVAKVIKAYGGPTALELTARRREEGTVTSTMHPGEKAPLRRLYDRRRGLRVEVLWRSGAESRVLSGGRGWREGRAVEGPPLVAMALQGLRLDLPALLRTAGDTVEDRGAVLHEGRSLRALTVPVGAGLTVEADVDPATGRILRSRGAASGPPAVEFITTYSDFREVDGVLVAFREGNWANGTATGETVLGLVTFLDVVPEEAFRP